MGGAFFGVNIASGYLRDRLTETFRDSEVNSVLVKKCYSEASFTHTIYYASIPLIVLHEVLLYIIIQYSTDAFHS